MNSVFSFRFSLSCSQWKRIDDIVSMIYRPLGHLGPVTCFAGKTLAELDYLHCWPLWPQKQDIKEATILWTLLLLPTAAQILIQPLNISQRSVFLLLASTLKLSFSVWLPLSPDKITYRVQRHFPSGIIAVSSTKTLSWRRYHCYNCHTPDVDEPVSQSCVMPRCTSGREEEADLTV